MIITLLFIVGGAAFIRRRTKNVLACLISTPTLPLRSVVVVVVHIRVCVGDFFEYRDDL